ncbi:MAG: HAMP domain-containing histidine kinase [Bacteroidales bacterium]|nr:HAMP domain-containing histidine kinase [Bacteroidales bacterium]MBN2818971.1 HAMP domain-containing histidine kinase [Bacteroidales bacterium]
MAACELYKPDSFPKKLITKVSIHDTLFNVWVISPINNENEIIGYDIVQSCCSKILRSIIDSTESLQITVKSALLNSSTNFEKKRITENDKLVFKHDSVFFISRSDYSDVYFAIGKKDEFLFKELNSFRNRQLITMFLIIIAFSLLIFIIQKRSQLLFLRKSKILENLVTEKTTHLNEVILELEDTNKTLSQREKELVVANQTKDKFFSIIAHDLINPISSLMGLSDILLSKYNEIDAEHKKELIEAINESTQNTFKLLDNLLNWARLQRGAIEFKPTRLNLYNIVEETKNFLKTQASNKKQAIKILIPTDTEIFADKEMLTTIIRNLISNAIKFSNPGGSIEIGVRVSEKKDNIEVNIKDNGIGMDAKTKQNLFKITQSVSKTGTAKETGTGLGLMLCKEFIDNHGGKIWVKSTPEKGSTFSFSIPQPLKSVRENE